MAQNPLEQFFRQPKIYINLPSRGIFNTAGTIQGDATNMPVYGMTAMDEIIAKTPDALFSGESTVKIIQSCVPGIKDGWNISMLDVDLIFAAIRIATYGDKLSVTHSCSKCDHDNAYDIELGNIIEHYNKVSYDAKIVLDTLVINLQPINYRQSTDINLRNYQLTRRLTQAENMEESEEKQEIINELFVDIAKLQTEFYTASVESIDTGKQVVTERAFISEFMGKCDKTIFDAIKKQIDKNKDAWTVPDFPAKCESCEQEDKINIILDQSNFFV